MGRIRGLAWNFVPLDRNSRKSPKRTRFCSQSYRPCPSRRDHICKSQTTNQAVFFPKCIEAELIVEDPGPNDVIIDTEQKFKTKVPTKGSLSANSNGKYPSIYFD